MFLSIQDVTIKLLSVCNLSRLYLKLRLGRAVFRQEAVTSGTSAWIHISRSSGQGIALTDKQAAVRNAKNVSDGVLEVNMSLCQE